MVQTMCVFYIIIRSHMAIATPNNGEGGYEYQFVTTPADWLMCNICHYPSRDPHLSGCCGHTFCKSCLDGAKKATIIANVCPICRDEEFPTVPNKQADRIVRSLQVFCTNKKRGCKWHGEVNNIVSHLINGDGCQFENVTCPYHCGMSVQRQYLSSHVEDECMHRMVSCQYCHITGEHQFIVGEHKDHCPKFPIACSNKCEVHNIPREDIDEHRKICPCEEVTCPNDCGMTLQRQYIPTHIKMECPRLKIDCQYCHIKGEQQFIDGKHKEQCHKFPIACPNKCDVSSVPRDAVEEHMKMCPLEIIQCEYHVVGCEERMARKDQKKHNKEKMVEHLSLTTHQLTSTQYDLASSKLQAGNSREELTANIKKDLDNNIKQQLANMQTNLINTQGESRNWKDDLIQQLAITKQEAQKTIDDLTQRLIVSQKEAKKTADELTQKLINTERELSTTKQQLATTCQNLTKAEKEHTTLVTSTDEALAKLETKITEIETAAQKRITELEHNTKLLFSDWHCIINTTASRLASGDQVVPVIVKMSEYTKKSEPGAWDSNSFYTHHKGYRMLLDIYAAGGNMTARGTHLSVCLSLMKGPYDDQLKWPLKGHCEVKLLNQISNSEHHVRNGEYVTDGHMRVTSGESSIWYMWCSYQFISNKDLHKITSRRQYLKDDSIFIKVDYKLD